MTQVYRGMTQAELDAGYNNSLAVADSPALLAAFEARSAKVRALHGGSLDLRYGPAERQRVDYFAASRPGPVLVFIHGGYWQMRAKETFHFLAAGPLAHGIHVAMIGYTLAPHASLAQIVDEVRDGLAWVRQYAGTFGGDGNRIVVSGWSAGGHLTAMCMNEDGVIGGLAISGIYDLEPIRLSYLNEKLGLAADDVPVLSPLHLPRSVHPMVITYGTAELPELRRQSMEFAAAGSRAADLLLPVKDRNHFTILDDLADPQGPLTAQARNLAHI